MNNFSKRTTAFLQKQYVLWLVIPLIVGLSVWIRHTEIFTMTSPAIYGQRYAGSQYVKGEGADEKIDDSTLYTYAAIAYLKGEDPTTINFEHPPLGKYFFSLSYLLFKRVLIINIFFMTGILVCFYYLMRFFQFPKWFTMISLLYVGLVSSLANHLSTALLDLQVLFFSLLFFLIFFAARERTLKYVLVGICLGALASIKYYYPIIFLYFGLLILWAIWQKKLKLVPISLFCATLVYVSSYSLYFWHSHTFFDLIKFEIFRFNWWTNDRQTFNMAFFEMLFRGSFPIWWEADGMTRLRESDWNFTWPLLFVLSHISLLFQKYSKPLILLVLFNAGLLTIYIVGSAVFGRYLLQLFPIWIIFIGSALFKPSLPQT